MEAVVLLFGVGGGGNETDGFDPLPFHGHDGERSVGKGQLLPGHGDGSQMLDEESCQGTG